MGESQYRCLLFNGMHLYTRHGSEDAPGATMEGVMGYVSNTERCGSTPLYRVQVYGYTGGIESCTLVGTACSHLVVPLVPRVAGVGQMWVRGVGMCFANGAA